MKRFAKILFGLMTIAGAATWVTSCAKDLQCGAGTVELNGQCVAGTPIAGCNPDAGDMIVGGICVPSGAGPLLCGNNTVFNPATGKCEGNGTGGTMCAPCSAPSSSTVCITGIVYNFVTLAHLTSTDGAKVRIYDPIAFATDPTVPPIGEGDIKDDGCYVVDGVNRPSSGFIAVGIDDIDQAGDAKYATMGAGSPLQANRNVTDMTAYALEKTQLDTWQQQLGAGLPSGCANGSGLGACGVWLGNYLDVNHNPVAGAVPTRQGDPINPNNLFCFTGGSKTDHMTMQLSATQKTTGPSGLCIISPDDLVPHGGMCGGSGCTCGGTACTPTWANAIAGTAPSVIFYQPFTSTM